MSRDTLSPQSEESIAVRAFGIIRRRRLLAFTAFATVLTAAVTFALYLPDLYRASAIVLIERPLSESFVRPAVSGEIESRLHVIKQEILSRDRLTALINRFGLYPELRKKTSFEDVLNQARNDIEVDPNGPEQVSGRSKTVTFTLSYTGNSRESVAEVTNAITSFYVQQNDLMRSEEAQRTTLFLKEQVDEAKQNLNRQEQSLRSYTSTHQSELPQAVSLNVATLQRLNEDLRRNGDAQIRVLEQRETLIEGLSEAEAITRSTSSTVLAGSQAISVSKELRERMDQLDELKTKLVDAEGKFAAQHPDVRALKEQIAAVENDVAAQRERDLAQYKSRLEADQQAASVAAAAGETIKALPRSRRTIESLDEELERLKRLEADLRTNIMTTERRLDSVPGAQQDYMLIQRDYQAAKDNYDVILRKFEEAQLVETVETDRQGERFRVLETALAPEGPAAPNRTRLMLMGLLLALAAAAAAVLAAEQLDSSFHSVDELREFTAIPVLATIPKIGPAPGRRHLRTAFATVSALAAITLVATLSAYIASGNEALVRMLGRAG